MLSARPVKMQSVSMKLTDNINIAFNLVIPQKHGIEQTIPKSAVSSIKNKIYYSNKIMANKNNRMTLSHPVFSNTIIDIYLFFCLEAVSIVQQFLPHIIMYKEKSD